MRNAKICIVGTSNLKHISLISLYTRYFDSEQIPYDIIYWDRYGVEESTTAQSVYRFYAKGKESTISRLRSFVKFRRYVKKIIKKKNYKYIITWQTTGAYLLVDFLLRYYKNRYVVNVRDYVVEKKFPFNILIKKLVKHAALTTISSEGFESFLPKGDYVKVNSVNEDILENLSGIPRNKNKVIKVGFAGNCRYLNESYKLIDALGNDKRFELWYCGTNSEKLAEYAKQKGVTNLFVKPAFDAKETVAIMSDFDFVNSAFGNDAMDNSTLMPIRLYTALAIHRPMLVNDKTQLGKEVSDHGLGYVITQYEGLGDKLADYYSKLDYEDFEQKCEEYLIKTREENKAFYTCIKNRLPL